MEAPLTIGVQVYVYVMLWSCALMLQFSYSWPLEKINTHNNAAGMDQKLLVHIHAAFTTNYSMDFRIRLPVTSNRLKTLKFIGTKFWWEFHPLMYFLADSASTWALRMTSRGSWSTACWGSHAPSSGLSWAASQTVVRRYSRRAASAISKWPSFSSSNAGRMLIKQVSPIS